MVVVVVTVPKQVSYYTVPIQHSGDLHHITEHWKTSAQVNVHTKHKGLFIVLLVGELNIERQ